jgi:hypothetical protein
MKSHEDFIKNDSAEKYILQQLSEKESLMFEEHLLYCSTCRDEVQKLEKSISFIQETGQESGIINSEFGKQYTNNRVINIPRYIAIAASILIVVSITWLYFHNSKKNNFQSEKIISKQEQHINANKEAKISNRNSSVKIKVAENKINEKYKALPTFESLVNNENRSEGIEVVFPANGKKFKPGSIIKFQWKKDNLKQLNLVIFNNNGKIISEQKIQSDYNYINALTPGLYYWQLETETESVYTGKFSIESD